MAFRATGCWRSILSRYQNTRQISTSTQLRMLPHATTTSASSAGTSKKFKAELIPIYTLFGMMFLALSLGTISATQQLVHCPNVLVDKKKRKIVPEVEHSDLIMKKSEEFVNKSLFRRFGQIRDSQLH